MPPGPTPTDDAPAKGRRPWVWIGACILLLLVAAGFAVWAFGLQSDLDDQKDQTAQAQQEVEQANQAVGELSAQVDDISQAISDAGDQIAQGGSDARQNIQDALDGLKSKLTALKDKLEQGIEDGGEAEATPTPTEAPATATPTEAPATATPADAQATDERSVSRVAISLAVCGRLLASSGHRRSRTYVEYEPRRRRAPDTTMHPADCDRTYDSGH